MNIGNFPSEQLLWLTIIHMVFVASALLLGVLDRMMNRKGT
jgi:uncharacterized membrane protein YqhA